MVATTVCGIENIGVCLGFKDGFDGNVGVVYMVAFCDRTVRYMCLRSLILHREEYLRIERPLLTVMLVDTSIPTEFFHDRGYVRDDLGNVSVKCKSGVVADPSFPRTLSVAKGIAEGVVVGMCVGKILTNCVPRYLVVFANDDRGEYSFAELELMRMMFVAGSEKCGLKPIAVSI